MSRRALAVVVAALVARGAAAAPDAAHSCKEDQRDERGDCPKVKPPPPPPPPPKPPKPADPKPKPPPPAVAKAQLDVQTDDGTGSGADLTLDGTASGTLPARLTTTAGRHVIGAARPGFAPVSVIVEAAGGAITPVVVRLAAAGPPPGVRVRASSIDFDSAIQFQIGKAVIQPASFPQLDAIAQALVDHAALHVEVGAHSDNRGARSYNEKLSQARADAVRAYLVAHGVAADRLTAKGYGESQPIDTNDTEEGRVRNRRISFTITAP